MSTLSKESRKQLGKVVVAARKEAESGAAAALESYGVGEARKPSHLDKTGEDLRRKLRAHGRQLGDVRRPDDSQEVERLVHQTAYEHWHRMLFARFLSENGFLIEPESGLDVDLDFCEERARATKSDKWEVAAGFAQRMLAGIFRSDDPVLQLRLPAETRNRLTTLLASLSAEVFTASDSLGWVYQFWQTDEKKKIDKSEVPIGAKELSPVTQLFTEDYMVDFLLDNTLGAWHAGKKLAENVKLAETARSEDEIRNAVAITGCPWSYLRFIKSEDGKWRPAAGGFDGWPKTAKELKCLDPCMGSGHFVVAMFERLVALRLAEEKMDDQDAVAAVIHENLFGLELDPRCTQIGAFNLALAAWRRVGHCVLPPMNLACSGLAPNTRESDWLAVADDNQKLRAGMERLYRLFQKADVLGSLINPRVDEDDLLVAAFHELQPLFAKAVAQEAVDDAAHEMAVTAQGLAKAAEILTDRFTLVATNVPYLGLGKQAAGLADHCERNYPEAKPDLATCFVERCQSFCKDNGTTALVTPQNWLFLSTYRKLRKVLLRESSWKLVVRLGANAFRDMNWWAATTALIITDSTRPIDTHRIQGVDVSTHKEQNDKAALLRGEAVSEYVCAVASVFQNDILGDSDARIAFQNAEAAEPLQKQAKSNTGLQTGDNDHYSFLFWELPKLERGWEFFHRTSERTCLFGGRIRVLRWEDGSGALAAEPGAAIRGLDCRGKYGVLVHRMNELPVTMYSGEIFDQNGAAVIPSNPSHLPALWCFLSSDLYRKEVRLLDSKTGVTPNTLAKVPFDLPHWQKVAAEKYPHGLPKPFSSDPTQWLFNGHPKGADQPLHVSVARLLGYQWPRQTGSNFPDCPALALDGLEKFADKDGVVCFSQVRNEPPAADRLRSLMAEAYGSEWGHAFEHKLIAATGSKASSLEEWLSNDFFAQHCDLYHQRPFIWHIWDGLKDGFNVLVNYHKLAEPNGGGHRTLETLTHAYLGDWITRQKDAVARGEAGADDRLAAALELQGELKKIVTGEPPFDLFVRWKPLHQQAIGWHPDINDGVRLNIRPFTVASLSRGKKGAGLLRAKPNIKWDKDRGKEPSRPKQDFPWFWKWDEQSVDFVGGTEFDGNRWNNCHYTTAKKHAARQAKGLR